MKTARRTERRAAWRTLSLSLAAAAAVSACGGGGGGGDPVTIPPFWSDGAVVATDLDGDGRVDIAVAAAWIDGPPPHAGAVLVYHGTGAGAFAGPTRYAVAADPWGLAVGDFDGDGRPDLLASSPSTRAPQVGAVDDSGAVALLLQSASLPGQWLPATVVPTGGATGSATFADLDADGRTDVAASDALTVAARALVLGHDAFESPAGGVVPVTWPLGVPSGSVDIASGDLDGDGLADLVVADGIDVTLLYQAPGGGFRPAVHLAAGVHVQGVALADLDGDGRPDIVAANNGDASTGGAGNASVTVFLQAAPSRFTASTIALPGGARQVVIGDLDGDGLPDLAVVSIVFQAVTQPSRVSVLLQSPTTRGQFASPVTYEGPRNASFIAIGDVDGDGRNDLVLNDGPSVMLQSATQPGTFGAPQGVR